ncbi:chaplin family protein [Streptomyces sp. ODS28]|uniref:chaplin n=1 Tax=Streptomyces sp. ODS28 TaxID=3136688 RepID=UPI0031F15CD5
MRQVTKKGLLTVVAASGVLAMSGGMAQADSGAEGGSTGSPGVLSGNSLEAPLDVPVNACGNTANVIAALNPASGNGCENGGSAETGGPGQDRGGAPNGQGSGHSPEHGGGGHSSPGSGAGEDRGGGGSPAPDPSGGGGPAPNGGGAEHASDPQQGPAPEGGGSPQHRPAEVRGSEPVRAEPAQAPARSAGPQLAETGSDFGVQYMAPLGAGLLVGGYVLYRRGRRMQAAARH